MRNQLDRIANIAVIAIAMFLLPLVVMRYLGSDRSWRNTSTPVKTSGLDSASVPNWTTFLVGGHARGPDTASVTILEFGDYECPFCARFAREVDRIMAAYPGQVRLVYRHWPLEMHRFAYPSARAAECAAEQARFWEMHNILYSMQDSLGLVTFRELALRAGADGEEFDACAARGGPVPSIEAGIRDAKAAGGTGTPTVIVNGIWFPRGVDSAYVASLLARPR
jgi:protein-disulfide isomerase